MTKPKPGWPRVRFGDVVRLNTDRSADPAADGIERYVAIEHIEPEDLRIRSWGLVAEGTTFTQRIRPGQTLFVKRRAYQRKVAVAEFDAVCSGDIYVLEPKDDRLLPDLLPFLCQTDAFFHHAVNTSAGSLSPRTNWTQLAQYEFALPPLAEQQGLIMALKAMLDVEETLSIAQEKSQQVKRAFVNEIFFTTGKDYQEYGGFRVPSHWQLLTLPELVVTEPHALIAGPFGTIFRAKDFRPEGIPIIQIRHVTDRGFRFDDRLTFMDFEVYQRIHKPYTVRPGDLLITKMGEPPGIACLYPDDAPIGIITPDVVKAMPDLSVAATGRGPAKSAWRIAACCSSTSCRNSTAACWK